MLSTGGLVLAVSMCPSGWPHAAGWGAAGMPHGTVNDPRAFVSIAPDGVVTIVCHRSEMGQGVRTGIPIIVADEMEADWARVKIAQATGDEAKSAIRTPTAPDPPAVSWRRCASAARRRG